MVKINTAVLEGIEGKAVSVEVKISNGIPSFVVIGLGDQIIKEAGERIKNAIVSSGFSYPKGKIVVNLSPADVKKRGSQMELAVAIGILVASGEIPPKAVENVGFFGELSLNGELVANKGILPMAIELSNKNIDRIVMPCYERNICEIINMDTFMARNLGEVVELIKVGFKKDVPEAAQCQGRPLPQDVTRAKGRPLPQDIARAQGRPLPQDVTRAQGRPLPQDIARAKGRPLPQDVTRAQGRPLPLDFSQVRGQPEAKRAITVASAGCHDMLMVGSPGAGKTMLAKRIPTVLPDLTRSELLEVLPIYSAMGKELEPLGIRPFRAPHYKMSQCALIGGGTAPTPGEITLAHRGVLFLDELGEYSPSVLDSLRTPLEEKKITINRRGVNYTFPADFFLVAATNPCKCGNFGSENKICLCSPQDINRYKRKLLSPVTDRIHIHIYVPNISYEEYHGEDKLDSHAMKEMVLRAREIQKKRYEGLPISFNSQLEGAYLKEFCTLDHDAQQILEIAYNNLNLSPRSYENILKVSRTIADINGKSDIGMGEILEALSYRGLDKIYGKE